MSGILQLIYSPQPFKKNPNGTSATLMRLYKSTFDKLALKSSFYLIIPHCSNWKKVLNENDTPQNQQFLSVYTLEVPKYSKLEKSIGIQGKNSKLG